MQITGIWDPYQLDKIVDEKPKKNIQELLEDLNLADNYFSIRGQLVYVNNQKKELVIKICSSKKVKNLKNNNFKLVIKGEIPLALLNNFLSLDVMRDGTTLKMIKYEIIEKNIPNK